jgi:NAD(P)-dependent dehydrogenase (short-subunit alcohol dehydrogenase family)
MVDVDIKGVLNGVAAVLLSFIGKKFGHVIATSSVAGLKAYPNGAVYGGTKWFLRDFMEVLRLGRLPWKKPTSARQAYILLPSILNCSRRSVRRKC